MVLSPGYLLMGASLVFANVFSVSCVLTDGSCMVVLIKIVFLLQTALVKLLLSHQANPHLVNCNGEKPSGELEHAGSFFIF